MGKATLAEMTRQERFNFIVSCSRGALLTAAKMFTTGTIMQTFLAEYGVSSALIGVYTMVLHISDIVTTMLFSDIADKGKRVKGTIMLLSGLIAVFFLPLILLCSASEVPAGVAFGVTLAVGIVHAALSALRNVYSYKLPYLVFDISYYGIYCSCETLVGNLTSIGTNSLLVWFLARQKYTTVMFFAFLFAALFFAVTVYLNKILIFSEEGLGKKEEKKKISPVSAISTLLKLPVFSHLMLPSFLRGVAAGVLTMAAVILMKMGGDATDTSFMVTVSSAAAIAGAAFFAFLSRKFDARDLCMAGSIAVAIFPIIGLGGKNLFFVVYFVIMFGKIVVDLSVPTFLYRYIPYEISGEYHAWRLILNTAGMAASSLLTGLFTEYLSPVWIAAAAGLLSLVSGLLYRFSPVLKKENILN